MEEVVENKMNIKGTVKEIIQTAVVSLGIFFFVYVFLVQPHRVKGESMTPNFKDGELLLVEKVSYRIYKPSRGDVIVFKAPGSANVDFIKRVIGVPGENVKVENGTVYINDKKLNEPYEKQETRGDININLGNNQYFVLGDNRGGSSDSRVFGPIDRNTIEGKAWFVYWPLIKNNQSEGARILLRVDYGVPDSFYNP
ncbi:signal peptidase I [Candidatus Curtissbacteria bacterium]|nr:signal peptidase I [Candidatus Curtissbacteria bacterium]